MPSHLLKAVNKLDNLERAWRVIQQNGRTSKSEAVKLELERFAENAPHNLRSLMGRLVRGSFKFEKAKGIPVPKIDSKGKPTGRIRPIVLAPVESRIVQRAILNVLVEIEALKPYVKTPYSYGGIRSARKRDNQDRGDELSAVPAAIQAVLTEIGHGARYMASADIRAFFTRVSKEHVLSVITVALGEENADFLAFLGKAITVELENLARLKEKAAEFPTEEIGVAQGNSLSPLLGNIALAEFDRVMNEGDCRCIRYIDDFIIMAPTHKAANARLARSVKLLAALQMELSPEKSCKGGMPIISGFDFLGITICPGLIRPSEKAQARFVASVSKSFAEARKAMLSMKGGQTLERDRSLIATLKRVDGIIDGWGKHYWFCNDGTSFANLDERINAEVAALLGCYRSTRETIAPAKRMQLLGLSELATIKREPFCYPKHATAP